MGVIALSQAGDAQNTGGVFGPIVNDSYAALQYRAAYDLESDGFAQRVHYEESLNGDFMWRTVLGTHKTVQSDSDFDFFQAELFWELSDDNDPFRTGLRFDLHLRDRDRPHFLGVHWMNQFNLNEHWSCRFLTMSTVEFGGNANHGVFLQTRASVTYRLNEHLSLGAELYDSYGSTDDLLGFADQTNQLGPVANYSFGNDFSVYGGVLYGISDSSPDSQLRLWFTKTF